MASPSITRFLAREVLATSFDDAPPEAKAAVKNLFVDHVGINYMGHAFVGRELAAYAKQLGGPPEAVILGDGARVPAEVAAAVNAQNARNTDYEDTGPGLHPGPMCVHTALAVGQRQRASGKEVLGAILAGYLLCGRFHFSRTKDVDIPQMSSCAAAIAGKLLKFGEEDIGRAMSLAWEFPKRSTLYTKPLTYKRVSGVGFGNLFFCRSGVQAALMTACGFHSLPDEIDQHRDDYDVAKLIAAERPYHYLSRTMQLKPWVTSRFAQGVVQTLGEIVRDTALDPATVTRVRVWLPAIYLIPHQFEPAPDRYFEALYSTQWAMAMTLQGIPPGTNWVTAERLADPLSRALAKKVEIIEDREATRAFDELRWLDIAGTVEVEAAGRTHRGRRTLGQTYGSPDMPMTPAMVEAKFMDATARSLPPARAQALYSALLSIDSVDDIGTIADLM
jgi:2-methylcitrate dehydratase PrpD